MQDVEEQLTIDLSTIRQSEGNNGLFTGVKNGAKFYAKLLSQHPELKDKAPVVVLTGHDKAQICVTSSFLFGFPLRWRQRMVITPGNTMLSSELKRAIRRGARSLPEITFTVDQTEIESRGCDESRRSKPSRVPKFLLGILYKVGLRRGTRQHTP